MPHYQQSLFVSVTRVCLFSVAAVAAIGAVQLAPQHESVAQQQSPASRHLLSVPLNVAPGGAEKEIPSSLASHHGCPCKVQKPDFPLPCFDRLSNLTGLAWAEQHTINRPFCAVDFEASTCSYPEAQPHATPGEGRVLLSCTTDEALKWWAEGGGLVECREGAKSVLGPVGGAKATCAGLLTGDECAARGDATPHAVCAHAGQKCADASAAEGDWECVCPETQVMLAPGKTAAAVCTLDECAQHGSVCSAAGQRCVEVSTSPARTNDWSCNCDTEKGLVGSRRGAAAECRRIVSMVQTVSGAATAPQASAPSFVSAFEQALSKETGLEATVFEVRQRKPEGAEAADATQIEAVIVAGAGDDTAAIRRRAVVPPQTVASLFGAAPGALTSAVEARDVIECGEQEHAEGSHCVRCRAGTENRMGDRADAADTKCAPLECAANEFVSSHVCVPCSLGLENDAGDEATGTDTWCAPPGARRGQALGATKLAVTGDADAREADAASIVAREATAEANGSPPPSPPMTGPKRQAHVLGSKARAGDRCSEFALPDECTSTEAEVCVAAYVTNGCIGTPQHVPKQCSSVDPSCVGVACAGLPKCMQYDECKWDVRQGCMQARDVAREDEDEEKLASVQEVCPECGVTVTASHLFVNGRPRQQRQG